MEEPLIFDEKEKEREMNYLKDKVTALKSGKKTLIQTIVILSLILLLFFGLTIFSGVKYYQLYQNTKAEAKEQDTAIETYKNDVSQSKDKLSEKDAKIQELLEELNQKNLEISELKQEIKDYEYSSQKDNNFQKL